MKWLAKAVASDSRVILKQRNGFASRRFQILGDSVEVREGFLNRVEYRVPFVSMSEEPEYRTIYSVAWLTLTAISVVLLVIFVGSNVAGADTDPLLGGVALYGGFVAIFGFFLWMSWGRTIEFPSSSRSLALWRERPSVGAVTEFVSEVLAERQRYLARHFGASNAIDPAPPLDVALGELDARVGRALGAQYDVRQMLGEGGFGVVFAAYDRLLDRMVAVKVLRDELTTSAAMRGRFLREARLLALLQHPNILPIHFVGEPDSMVFIVMPFVDGSSLRAVLSNGGRLSPAHATSILADCADALSGAHAAGVIHRDVKPENVMLDGPRQRVLVMDFGIAKPLDDKGTKYTQTGMPIGSLAYMSPEQARGDEQIDGRSDIYSLGVMGYELLVGELPFRAQTVLALAHAHNTQPPPPMPDHLGVHSALSQAIDRCLKKRPEERWQSAAELRDHLREMLS